MFMVELWIKNGRFCTMARQERYKKDRILLAKSAGFGPAAALSGFQSGGRLCRSARSRYRLCPTTPPALIQPPGDPVLKHAGLPIFRRREGVPALRSLELL